MNCAFILLVQFIVIRAFIDQLGPRGIIYSYAILGIPFAFMALTIAFVETRPILIGKLYIVIGLIWIILIFAFSGEALLTELFLSSYFLNWIIVGSLFLISGLIQRKQQSTKIGAAS